MDQNLLLIIFSGNNRFSCDTALCISGDGTLDYGNLWPDLTLSQILVTIFQQHRTAHYVAATNVESELLLFD